LAMVKREEERDYLRIAIIHGRIRYQAKRQNMHKLSAIIADVMSREDEIPDLLVLPPYPLTGPLIGYNNYERTMRYIKSNAERVNEKGYTVQFIRQRMTPYYTSVLAGPIIERAGPKLFNTMLLVDQDHVTVHRYRKISVSSLEAEYKVNPGKVPGVFIIPGMNTLERRIGVFIENDIMHGEIFRMLSILNSWVIIGAVMPTPYLKPLTVNDEKEGVYTVNTSLLESLAAVRAMESKVPVIVVGAILENVHGELMSIAPTIIADPDMGIVKVQQEEDVLRLDVAPPEHDGPCDVECKNIIQVAQKYYRQRF